MCYIYIYKPRYKICFRPLDMLGRPCVEHMSMLNTNTSNYILIIFSEIIIDVNRSVSNVRISASYIKLRWI